MTQASEPQTDRSRPRPRPPLPLVIGHLKIDVLTLFPAICEGPLNASILARARTGGALEVRVHDLRAWTRDRHRTADDTPYGGGQGMLLKPEPMFAAVADLRDPAAPDRTHVVLLTPQGRLFRQAVARELAAREHLVFVCGHYEGVDHRVAEHLADEELSVGEYVLTNGAIAAVVVIDAVARLLPGVLGDAQSAADDSFGVVLDDGRPRLEAPQYTRPAEFNGLRVPEVLLGGNHGAIARWRREQAVARTQRNRPDLLLPPPPDLPSP